MTIFHVIILSVIEGLTEFIPVSSTGHLIITSHLLGLTPSVFLSSFNIAIQLGAIAAVVVLYTRTLLHNRKIMSTVAVAFLPTAIIGFLLYKIFKSFLADNLLVVAIALGVGGLILLAFEWWYEEQPADTSSLEEISFKQAFIIGICQSLAIIPGVSRSGATIVAGMCLRLKRKVIVEFSFLLAIPTMAAATGYDLLKSAGAFSTDQWGFLVIGSLVSFVISLITVKWFLHFVQRYSFSVFAIYRLALALLIIIFLL